MALALISLFHPSSNAMILGESMVAAAARDEEGHLTGSRLGRAGAAGVRAAAAPVASGRGAL